MPEGTINQGIGASVRRKEDKKFITGKGRYTDDINRNGQLFAHFIRSDVAHANIKNIDISAAAKCKVSLPFTPERTSQLMALAGRFVGGHQQTETALPRKNRLTHCWLSVK